VTPPASRTASAGPAWKPSVAGDSTVTQDYLKVVWAACEWGGAGASITGLAKRMEVAPSTASENVARLVEEGLLVHKPYRAVTLSEEGRRRAMGMIRRHRILETYLVTQLGFGWDEVHAEAEELEHAIARGAHIYAELVGTGLSADAYHLTATHPDGLGAKLVMTNALEDAGLSPEDIDYINVHGTSTPVGDISESKAIKEVFGDAAYKLNISSTKSMTGHLLGAAGAIEAVFALKAVEEDIVPPTINHAADDEDPEIDYKLNFTFNEAQRRPVRAALSNTFGFGGHNASVIFKKYVK